MSDTVHPVDNFFDKVAEMMASLAAEFGAMRASFQRFDQRLDEVEKEAVRDRTWFADYGEVTHDLFLEMKQRLSGLEAAFEEADEDLFIPGEGDGRAVDVARLQAQVMALRRSMQQFGQALTAMNEVVKTQGQILERHQQFFDLLSIHIRIPDDPVN